MIFTCLYNTDIITSSDTSDELALQGAMTSHDDVIKWKHFPRYCPFVRGIHRSPVVFPHKGRWHGVLMFSLMFAWTKSWANDRDAGDLRRHCAHYDATVMTWFVWHLGLLVLPGRQYPIEYARHRHIHHWFTRGTISTTCDISLWRKNIRMQMHIYLHYFKTILHKKG